jgi:hypothetical protein
MNTIDKLNNTLGYLTAMSFDRPELSNDLVEPLNTLSEAISEVENLTLTDVSQQRELLIAFNVMRAFDIKHDDIEESIDYFFKHKKIYLL